MSDFESAKRTIADIDHDGSHLSRFWLSPIAIYEYTPLAHSPTQAPSDLGTTLAASVCAHIDRPEVPFQGSQYQPPERTPAQPHTSTPL
jgi:hypothetical protein